MNLIANEMIWYVSRDWQKQHLHIHDNLDLIVLLCVTVFSPQVGKFNGRWKRRIPVEAMIFKIHWLIWRRCLNRYQQGYGGELRQKTRNADNRTNTQPCKYFGRASLQWNLGLSFSRHMQQSTCFISSFLESEAGWLVHMPVEMDEIYHRGQL
jgi:hypothetical protein